MPTDEERVPADGPRVLVAGTGMGCRVHIPALRAAGFDVVGLVGTDAVRTAERAKANGVARAFVDLDEAIGQTEATAVTIATPPETHERLVLQAVAGNCHVLCEKPFATNAEAARKMLLAAERSGLSHALGNEFRWEPRRAAAALALRSGLIGEPRMICIAQFLHYVGNPAVRLPDWWLKQSEGGGWLGASGSHLVDWIRTWLGDFASLSASLPNVSTAGAEAEDSFLVQFRLTNGVSGSLVQTAGAWGPRAELVRVVGTTGTLWFDQSGVWVADKDGTRDLPIPAELELPLAPRISADPRQRSAEWQMLASVELPPFIRLCEAWRANIEGRPAPGPVSMPTFVDGLATTIVLDAVRASAQDEGKTIIVTGNQ